MAKWIEIPAEGPQSPQGLPWYKGAHYLKVRGGWLVTVTVGDNDGAGVGLTFVPDPLHDSPPEAV